MSDYVPEEILKWLPVKTLLRFRCVSRLWKEIIDSPLFMQNHLALQKSRLLVKYEEPDLLVLDPDTLPSVESLSLPSPLVDESDEPIKPCRLVGTLHGVVCLHDNADSILIWNPSTRKLSSIPVPGFHFEWRNVRNVELLPYSGFWINPSDKHYKVIMFKLVYAPDPSFHGYLYSSIDQAWGSVPLDVLEDFKPYSSETPPVMIDGVAYWRANCKYYDDEVKRVVMSIVVLSYDFASGSFGSFNLPESTHYLQFKPTLCRLRDTLGLVSWELSHSDRCDVHIWVDNMWIRIMGFEVCIAAVFRVSWVLGETQETCRLIAETGEELVLYDTQDNPEDNLDVLKSQLTDSTNMYMAYDFVESLLFP